MMALMVKVPAFGYVDEYWVADSDGMTSRSARAAASGPYRSTVPPAIAGWVPDIPADLSANVEEATAALSRFDEYAAKVLGTTSPTLGPMSSILLRTESASSSQIEDLTVGPRQLALAEIEQSTSANARTVVANVRAMEAALALADRLDADAILEMHRALLSGQRGWEDHAGRWRDQLVWIGTSAISPRGASHVAPQAPLVPPAMEALVGFVPRAAVLIRSGNITIEVTYTMSPSFSASDADVEKFTLPDDIEATMTMAGEDALALLESA